MNIIDRIIEDSERYTDKAITNLEARLRNAQNAMQFWPQTLTVPLTIPEGQQLVLDVLTIAEGATLTVNGHLRILSWLENNGTLEIGANGSLWRF